MRNHLQGHNKLRSEPNMVFQSQMWFLRTKFVLIMSGSHHVWPAWQNCWTCLPSIMQPKNSSHLRSWKPLDSQPNRSLQHCKFTCQWFYCGFRKNISLMFPPSRFWKKHSLEWDQSSHTKSVSGWPCLWSSFNTKDLPFVKTSAQKGKWSIWNKAWLIY